VREGTTCGAHGRGSWDRERMGGAHEGNWRRQVGPTGQREGGSVDARARVAPTARPGCQGGVGARGGLAGLD
jgi:hypothetical protein